jgi:hypothetical protein
MAHPDHCTVSVSDIMPGSIVRAVRIEPYDDPVEGNLIVTTNIMLEEKISGADALRWYEDESNLPFLRFRLLVCPKEDFDFPMLDNVSTPVQVLDYCAQRFNEFLKLPDKNVRMEPEQYLAKIKEKTVAPISEVVGPSMAPVYVMWENMGFPFNSSHENYIESAEKKNYRFRFDNPLWQPMIRNGCLKDVVFYDRPLGELLPRNTLAPVQPNGQYPIAKRRITNVQGSSPQTEGRYELEQIDLLPISLYLGPSFSYPDISLRHLSVYGYVYFDYKSFAESLLQQNPPIPLEEDPTSRSVLEDGLGMIGTATVIGNKYTYTQIWGDSYTTEQFRRDEDDEYGETVITTEGMVDLPEGNWGIR